MISAGMIKSVWAYRNFIWGSVKREFQSRYRNSILGAAWTVLNPLSMILVYTVVFSQVMGAKLPGTGSPFAYGIYLCAGILTWGLFADIILRGQNMFLGNAELIKKISFPRICLPVIMVLNASLNFAIIFFLFSLFLIISGSFPGVVFVGVFPVLVIQMLLACGLAVILGTLNVFFRDVGHLTGIFMQFWFWFTPIVYPQSILPESLRPLLLLNPMAGVISSYQQILVNGHWPQWLDLLPALVLGVALCLLGLMLFRQRVGEMVDEL